MDLLDDVAGVDGLLAAIAGVQERFPGWTIRLRAGVEVHHDVARFTWQLGPDGAEPPVVGFDVATFAPDGRIAAAAGFLDKVPAAARAGRRLRPDQ